MVAETAEVWPIVWKNPSFPTGFIRLVRVLRRTRVSEKIRILRRLGTHVERLQTLRDHFVTLAFQTFFDKGFEGFDIRGVVDEIGPDVIREDFRHVRNSGTNDWQPHRSGFDYGHAVSFGERRENEYARVPVQGEEVRFGETAEKTHVSWRPVRPIGRGFSYPGENDVAAASDEEAFGDSKEYRRVFPAIERSHLQYDGFPLELGPPILSARRRGRLRNGGAYMDDDRIGRELSDFAEVLVLSVFRDENDIPESLKPAEEKSVVYPIPYVPARRVPPIERK